ncbi:MAG: porin [Holosporaceae bacterium]|jgi:predicted porin|nr:porin [Holosporaceae bacterium]
MKKVILLTLLLGNLCEAVDTPATSAKNEEKLLNELVSDALKANGMDCPISFRGTLNFSLLGVSQNKRGDNACRLFALESDIFVKNLNKCDQYDFGFEVGAKANSGIIKQGGAIIRTAYLFLTSDATGTVKLGYTPTMADSLTINGGSVLVGYGGYGSRNLSLFYNESAGSFVDDGFPFDDSKAAKIAYLSREFSGLSLGLSFTPDSRTKNPFQTIHPKVGNRQVSDEKANCPGMRTAYSKNIVTGGIVYKFGDPKAFNGKLALCGWLGKGKTTLADVEVNDIRAYNLGVIFGYKDFKLALGYSNNCESLRSKRYASADITVFDVTRGYTLADANVGLKPGADAGQTFSVGAAYAINDRLTVSAGYFRSEVKFSMDEKATADVTSLAFEYVPHKSCSVYLEYNNVQSDSCPRAQAYHKACKLSTTGKNRGNMLILGLKLSI